MEEEEEGSSPGECVNHAGVAYQDCAGCGSQHRLMGTALSPSVCVCVCGNPREYGYGTSERGPPL